MSYISEASEEEILGGGSLSDHENNSDGNGSNSGGSTSGASSGTGTTGNGAHRRDEDEVAIKITRKESEQVCWLRGLVSVVMLLAAFTVSMVIFYSTRKSENDQFEAEFRSHAATIIDSFEAKLLASVVSMDNLAVSLTSLGLNSAFQWPYATLPQWDVRARSAAQSASAQFLAYSPLVADREREAWQNFALTFKDWVDSDQGQSEENSGERNLQADDLQDVDFSQGIASTIYKLANDGRPVVEESQEFYYPLWQHYPIDPELANFNILSHWAFGPEAQVATDSLSFTIGMVSDNALAPSKNPISNLYFPVFSDFDNDDLVALIVASEDWVDFLKAATLPETANGIICVIVNECGQAYSYEVRDDTAYFLSEGDRHDSNFDHMGESIAITAVLTDEVLGTLSYSNTKKNKDFCPYTMYVYPSEATEQEYYTNAAALYTVLVVVVFLFTTCAFAGYDYLVER